MGQAARREHAEGGEVLSTGWVKKSGSAPEPADKAFTAFKATGLYYIFTSEQHQ